MIYLIVIFFALETFSNLTAYPQFDIVICLLTCNEYIYPFLNICFWLFIIELILRCLCVCVCVDHSPTQWCVCSYEVMSLPNAVLVYWCDICGARSRWRCFDEERGNVVLLWIDIYRYCIRTCAFGRHFFIRLIPSFPSSPRRKPKIVRCIVFDAMMANAWPLRSIRFNIAAKPWIARREFTMCLLPRSGALHDEPGSRCKTPQNYNM